MSRQKHSQQEGFTIVELMVATMVFGMILMVITAGVIHFTAAYYKSINTSATQNAARTIIGKVTQNLQFGGGGLSLEEPTPDGVNRAYCIGNMIIAYNLGTQLPASDDSHYGVFVTSKEAASEFKCLLFADLSPTQKTNGKELLGTNMRLTQLKIEQDTSDNSYTAKVAVAYGDIDLLCVNDLNGTTGGCRASDAEITTNILTNHPEDVGCKASTGGQFCAASHLSTQVISRFQGDGS